MGQLQNMRGKSKICDKYCNESRSGALQKARKSLLAGARPRIPLGELTTLPWSSSSSGDGDIPSQFPTPLGAFGDSILASSALHTRAFGVRNSAPRFQLPSGLSDSDPPDLRVLE